MLRHRWVDIDPMDAEHHPLYGIAGWLPWVLVVAVGGPTWVFWQGLSVDALQMAGADLFNADTPGSGVVNLTLLLYLISTTTVLVLATTHDSAFRPAMLVHMATLPPMIGLMLLVGGMHGGEQTLIDGVAVALLLLATCGVYLQLSQRVRVTFEHQVPASGEPQPRLWHRRRVAG
ncbi:hypothetical protein [Ralstonia solanacearum]|uniref:Transmembrane protein n=3 Tax=Ralstonia solanacearum TaxID=305 RepID=F6G120_RALS8|nr:hypothetical protein [Ralstonia solanacearum]AEG69150.1 conserved membrane protein of unknown function [Ralstonia solanacearum Po82]AMP70520.1 hypothetical protein UW163_14155 [Ralstonia solanacearum]AMP72793.1 hypothetical protein RALBFv3_00835 [Ralstonia solanacearum]AYB60698.1 hypothetical protein C2124_08935 [Ralstonia solanacearum]MBB6587765.1 hypothetical protein [Ralstonia solanacearum]